MFINSNNYQISTLNLVLLFLLLPTLLLLVWGLNKGFDLSDEGFHMLLLHFPSESGGFNRYQWLFSWMNLGIISSKVVRLLLTLLSSAIFSWGLWRWIQSNSFFKEQHRFFNFTTLYLFITLATFVNYSQQPRTLSYNNLTMVFMQLAVGVFCYFLVLNKQQKPLWQRLFALIGIALMLAFLWLTKFPAAISLFLLFVFVLLGTLLNQKPSFKTVLMVIGGSLVLCVIFIGAYSILTHKSITNLYESTLSIVWKHYSEYNKGVNKYNAQHNIFYLLISYYNTSYKAIVTAVFKPFTVPLLFFALSVLYRYIKNNIAFPHNQYAYWIVPIVGIGVMGVYLLTIFANNWHINGDRYNRNAFNLYLFSLACLGAATLGFASWEWFKKWWQQADYRDLLLILFMLFMLPIGGAAGTNNPLPLQCTQQAYAWCAIFFIMGYYLSRKTDFALPQWTWLLVLAGLVCSQVYQGYAMHPFRLNGNMFNQKQQIKDIPLAAGVYVDSRTKNMVQRIYNLIHDRTKFEEGDPIISFTYNPGITYLMGGVSPTSPYYKNERNFFDRNCFNIMKASLPNLHNTIIIDYSDRRISSELKNCFLMQGIDLEGTYLKIGTVPYYRSKNRKLAIYAPKHLLITPPTEEELSEPANQDLKMPSDEKNNAADEKTTQPDEEEEFDDIH
ncbi:MAG: hypothetical protein JNM36_12040 [Chitinophagales bacterium]|nr:hypothetical protein [Chitinophagales bacterium]